MGTRVALQHRMCYRYEKPVRLGPQLIRLHPASHAKTPILSYSLDIRPSQHTLYWEMDAAGNHVARVLLANKTEEFSIEVNLVADLAPVNPFHFLLEAGNENFPFQYSEQAGRHLYAYRTPGPATPELLGFLRGFDTSEKRATVSLLIDLTAAVNARVRYIVRTESGVQSPEETLMKGEGSCRDSAWLLAEVLRQLGFASRFVSGYLINSDSTELHAWTEVFLPGPGWVGLDASSGLFAAEGHVPLACTPYPQDAAAVSGTVEPAQSEFTYSLRVLPIETRASRPLTVDEEQWERVRMVAHQIDRDLEANDVRLTMGGEPTYVGLDEPDSPQWNGAALGDLKRELGVTLIKRLAQRIAPGALLHFGQGKWYPGEPLPRWALQCFWRVDGQPVWRDPALIADDARDYGYTGEDALRFLKTLCRRLQVSDGNILTAYEDALYYIWRERKLPVNVDVLESKLGDAREREELARIFTNGLENPVGYVLPLRRRQDGKRLYWSSQLWFMRPERVHLLQGDSPIGFRLPLDSLPWVTPEKIEYDYELDPFDQNNPLPEPKSRPDFFEAEVPPDPLPAEPQPGASAEQVIRPALSVEARGGRIHVFLPYTTKLPDYLDLINAVEDTAAYLNWPIWIEGYAPPSDVRLHAFSITPDPGVIEVNLPPAAGWDQLEHVNRVVDEEARACRLTAEKFFYDGKHTATNGGNHIVLGGARPADSPLLRRPDLLRSMVAFWQNHPSLSYLFSGTFIGPTSQYPRVDEARMDSLYELEIAFSQLPDSDCPPWMVDRLFRNLLVDMTGNTHRAEFCIDKLYPPQGSRLGLLELRAFEMAPDVKMGLLELLLIRALVALFWQQPYESNLVRWGTRLHEWFMLPHYVTEDFRDVLTTLQRAGYDLDFDWFRPQIDFRFPVLGSIQASDMELELRQALEPWHVLGEEASGAGTVRSVDSSLERLQVKVTNWNEARYVLTCNGRRVPLQATKNSGEAVAGVRYRAWLPPSALHPTIGVQAPLQFEIVDTWNKASMGSCSYHVVHPDGRLYEARPKDLAEAGQRRAERFVNGGRLAGLRPVPAAEQNPVLSSTLDLRWPAPEDLSRIGTPVIDAFTAS